MLLTSQPPSLDTRDSVCPGLVIPASNSCTAHPVWPRRCGRALGPCVCAGPRVEG